LDATATAKKPLLGRTIYLVRAGEPLGYTTDRYLTNNRSAWIDNTTLNPLGLKWDNAPLSPRGRSQSENLSIACVSFPI
jgi:broad specificity phosphatase PhoE